MTNQDGDRTISEKDKEDEKNDPINDSAKKKPLKIQNSNVRGRKLVSQMSEGAREAKMSSEMSG